MKFFKLVTLILAVCLVCGTFVACNKGEDTETTVAEQKTTTVDVEVHSAGKAKYKGTYSHPSTRGELTAYALIEWFCTQEDIDFEATDDKVVTKIGDIVIESPQYLAAYYENQGKNNSFEKLTTQVIEDGTTVIFYVK